MSYGVKLKGFPFFLIAAICSCMIGVNWKEGTGWLQVMHSYIQEISQHRVENSH